VRRADGKKAAPSTRPRRPSVADTLRVDLRQLEERLAHLEELLHSVRAEAGRSTGAARARLERIDQLLATRIRTTQETLRASLDRMSRTLADSRNTVERELDRLTRGLRAGVKAGREALRRPPPG